MRTRGLAAAVFLLAVTGGAGAGPNPTFVKDVEFALAELKKDAGHLFKLKGIDWKAVSREMRKASREAKTVEEHWVVLARLIARIRDGHAYVKPLPAAGEIAWPLAPESPRAGPGMFWCRSGGKIYVKSAWSASSSVGITPGMQVVAVDGIPVEKWLEAKIAERADLMSYSTDHQAFFAACHWGLERDRGSRMKVELRTVARKRKKANITIRRASTVPSGPVFPPEGLKRTGRQSYGRTAQGYGYIHLRDAKSRILAQMDEMLAALGDVPGLILDCRANGGGAFDHGAFFGRFVPKGKNFEGPSAGPNPYPGNVVVIIDAGVRSAGETLVGMLKEAGRAYLIGETPTAGMSSSKKELTLPSGLFLLFYSVRSNGRNFNKGRGIEGVGIPPHEVVEYDPKDLAEGVDTMIRRAEKLLADFPVKEVRYRPPR